MVRSAEEARRKNQAYRTRILYQVHRGERTPWDVISDAVEDSRLRPISLRSLFLAASLIGDKQMRDVLAKAWEIAHPGVPQRPRKQSVGWLVKDVFRGRTWEAFVEAYTDPRATRFGNGFPWHYTKVINNGERRNN
ncbi:hypothetical protein GCM10025777_38650 [Membranihabitans marinus]|uniref:Uncharacterized protein n=1 Tax=Nesterenkonia rhizosphaerae TaxID=1348272 RepID=A0ABP9G0H8_9MICC